MISRDTDSLTILELADQSPLSTDRQAFIYIFFTGPDSVYSYLIRRLFRKSIPTRLVR